MDLPWGRMAQRFRVRRYRDLTHLRFRRFARPDFLAFGRLLMLAFQPPHFPLELFEGLQVVSSS
jgi:hypothetical protein